jgi:membrane-associated protease RseP (regulator of RpoE activity)
MNRRIVHSCCIALLAATAPLAAQQTPPAEDRLARAIDDALATAWRSGDFPEGTLVLERPARERVELGAVVDLRGATDRGIAILAITPDSAAERIGLKVGDRLTAIDDTALAGTSAPAQALAQALSDAGREVRFTIARDGRELSLAGPVEVRELPAYRLSIAPITPGDAAGAPARPPADVSGCGYVSGGARVYGGVLKVKVESVDGKPSGAFASGPVRVQAGLRRLVLRPLPQIAVGSAPVVGVSQMPPPPELRRFDGQFPEFEINVEPGVLYRLGFDPRAEGGGRFFVAETEERRCP